MDYSFNSVGIIPDLKAAAAFTVNSSEVFKELEDITPVIIDKDLRFRYCRTLYTRRFQKQKNFGRILDIKKLTIWK